MTAIPSKPIPAYKTQWDSVARDIREVTRLGVDVPLCLSYLFPNTVFRGIPELVSYFQENDELYVPANQELAVLDTSVLVHDKEEPVVSRQTDINARIIFLMDTMISPIGKVFTRIFDVQGTINNSFKTGGAFAWNCSIGYTLKAVRGDLDVRFSDLTRLMVTCGIPRLEFEPKQMLRIWGIPNKEALSALLRARTPEGCTADIDGAEGTYLEEVTHNVTGCRGVRVSGEGLYVTIRDNFSFKSIADFAQRLALREIEVPPNQKLTICDQQFERIVRGYEAYREIKGVVDFVFDQMLMAYGYGVDIIQKIKGPYFDLDAVSTQVEIVNRVGCVLKRVKKSLAVDFRLLGHLMISQEISKLTLAPHQHVQVLGLSKEILEESEKFMLRKDLLGGVTLLVKALQKFNPLGFSWEIETKGIRVILRESNMEEDMLELSSPNVLQFYLKRPTGKIFIENVVDDSHPALLEGLKEVDNKAMKFLLFRAFFHYLCLDWGYRSDELPNFFRPEELRSLVPNAQGRMQAEGLDPILVVNNGEVCQLIDESTAVKIRQKKDNPKLAAAIEQINGSKEILELVRKITHMSPKEFDDFSLDTLPAPLQVVLKEVRELSNKELSKSPFINKHLKAFLAKLPEDSKDSSTDKKDDVKRD